MKLEAMLNILGLYKKLDIVSDGGVWEQLDWKSTPSDDDVYYINRATGEVVNYAWLMNREVALVRPLNGCKLEVWIVT